jgi:rRNA maturation protein Nop10
MDLTEYLKGLKKVSKTDPIPGTLDRYLDEKCPECGGQIRLLKPCCLYKFGTKECSVCGRKVRLTE